MDILLFFFNDTATTEIYTLSLHDALPIFVVEKSTLCRFLLPLLRVAIAVEDDALVLLDRLLQQGSDGVLQVLALRERRSEEHTSELQSRQYLVCRLLLEKKKMYINPGELT